MKHLSPICVSDPSQRKTNFWIISTYLVCWRCRLKQSTATARRWICYKYFSNLPTPEGRKRRRLYEQWTPLLRTKISRSFILHAVTLRSIMADRVFLVLKDIAKSLFSCFVVHRRFFSAIFFIATKSTCIWINRLPLSSIEMILLFL